MDRMKTCRGEDGVDIMKIFPVGNGVDGLKTIIGEDMMKIFSIRGWCGYDRYIW